MKNTDNTRYKYLTWGLLSILIFIVYSYKISYPYFPYYDEHYYVNFVRNLVYAKQYSAHLSVHPPLWHFMTSFLVMLFGDFSLVWRSLSLFAGIFSIFLIYPITKKITNNAMTSLFAVFFFTFDCVSITQSRIAMMNSLMMFFVLLSFLFYLYALDGEKSFQKKPLVISSLVFGLALSTKLVALSILALYLILLIFKIRERETNYFLICKQFFVYCVVVPIFVYFAVHLLIPYLQGKTLSDIWRIQEMNLTYNLNTAANQYHPYSSKWWTWPLMLKPIWYYAYTQYPNTPGTIISGIVCLGNPAMMWIMPIVILYFCFAALRRGFNVYGVVLSGYLIQWLYFSFTNRLMYFHYYYNTMPFIAMSLAVISTDIVEKWGTFGKYLIIIYLIIVAGMFAYWYPLLTGLPISQEFFRHHYWFKNWL